MFPKKELAQLVITACEYYNISKIVISPGSRNAPLTIGFSNSKKLKTFSIVDERCAAFFALGMAQQTRCPVALVCTSGSALLNYYPAIAEAFYSKIPLVIISADRPKHLLDIGDGQTIRQERVFENHIVYSANLSEDKNETRSNRDKLSMAMQTAIIQKGPVHINVPFDEPLYETVDELESFEFSALNISKNTDEIEYQKIIDAWNVAKRKLILVGVNYPSKNLQKALDIIVEDKTVLVMTETTSNLNNPKFINSIDQLISKLDDSLFKKLQPEVLITFGGFIVSKRVKQFLRKYKPKYHWHVDEHTKLDTYFSLTTFIQQKPTFILEKLQANNFNRSEKVIPYQKTWLTEKEDRNKRHKEFLDSVKYSDLKVMEVVLQSIPNCSQLQVSNSSLIRYVQLFTINPTLQVFCNRGTSGIDGSTSTAIGASLIVKEQTVFITGDISFFYDSNALWNSYIPKSFRIILINNDGGGIFKIIPGPKSTNALSYFETKHGLTAEHLATMFAMEYQCAKNLEEVHQNLQYFYEDSGKPKILEIFTPSQLNDKVLQEYFNYL